MYIIHTIAAQIILMDLEKDSVSGDGGGKEFSENIKIFSSLFLLYLIYFYWHVFGVRENVGCRDACEMFLCYFQCVI